MSHYFKLIKIDDELDASYYSSHDQTYPLDRNVYQSLVSSYIPAFPKEVVDLIASYCIGFYDLPLLSFEEIQERFGDLKDEELSLSLRRSGNGDALREGWPPYFDFEMRVRGRGMGRIDLRLAYSPCIELYAGHIGYSVEEYYRGHHYAEKACRLIFPLAQFYKINPLFITCNPSNHPSRRTLERLHGELIETVKIPRSHYLFRLNNGRSSRYRFSFPALHKPFSLMSSSSSSSSSSCSASSSSSSSSSSTTTNVINTETIDTLIEREQKSFKSQSGFVVSRSPSRKKSNCF
eukprot:TRINITY_DN5411_c0_g1_i2.p1 TRINITY_DN5411_c0_g1~~TRINITY_DN5411_c0_g1_i2.p1  ORF type:complete len:292 (-),score=43.76 TRINITY_DN5411_c0_g1_i2:167-1042(-)